MEKEKCCCAEKKPQSLKKQWLGTLGILIFLALLYRIFQSLGMVEKLGALNPGASYGAAFLVGIVASVSSCLAIVGSVVIAFSEKYRAKKEAFFDDAIKPNMLFHAGRLSSFFILGGLLGAIGGGINLSGRLVAIYTLIIAFIMAILGLNILGFFPRITALGLCMPKMFRERWDNLRKSENSLMPFFLGIFSFFLPCGFTQSMQLIALASGSFWQGGMILFLFALGTVPALMALGITTAWTRSKNILVFQKVAGVLILLFAFYAFNSGLALIDVRNNIFEKSNSKQKNLKTDVAEQIVEMYVTSAGFSPSVLKIKKGVPVRWVIKGDSVTSCTNKIIVPSLGISQSLNSGDNVVSFTSPDKIGEIPFSCWMGMIRGKFIVE